MQFDHETRVRILVHRLEIRETFSQIARQIPGVSADSARKLVKRITQRSGSHNISECLKHVDPAPRSGRPRRLEPGSKETIAIRDDLRYPGGKYQGQHKVEAANRTISKLRGKSMRQPLKPLANQQVHNILHGEEYCEADPHGTAEITKHKVIEKPPLEKLDFADRKRYIEYILSLDPDEVETILCDETPIDFGSGGHLRVWAPIGTVPYGDQPNTSFSKMQWDCASSETRPKRRIVVWNTESEAQSADLMAKFKKAKELLDAKVNAQREASHHPGTPEHQYLQHLNNEVKANNAALPKGQRKGRKQAFTVARAFPFEKIERDHKKGGLDFVYYAFEIYEKALFPYYEEVKALNPHKRVLILEDNVGIHHKARRLLAPLIQEKGIEFLDTPANSPDLQPIEHLHKDQKKLLQDFRFTVRGADRVIQDSAEIEMEHIWCHDSRFDAQVAWRANLRYIQGLCDRSKRSEPAYGNRYKDSL